MRYLPLAAAVFAWASLSAGQSQPATASAPTTARAEVARIAEELGRQLGSDDYQRREAAQAALAEAHRALLEAVAKHAADKDPEVKMRAAAALKAMVGEASCQQAALKLDAAQRAKLERFREKSPSLFACVFSPEADERVGALHQLAMRDDPKALAEPVLVICLGDSSERIQAAAAYAAGEGKYGSDVVVDALLSILIQHTGSYSWERVYPGNVGGSAPSQAVAALKMIHPKRAAPTLLALMRGKRGWVPNLDSLTDLLARTGEKRAVLELVRLLNAGDQSVRIRWGSDPNSPTLTTTNSDMLLMCLLRLTGQKAAEYGFVCPNRGFVRNLEAEDYGFNDEEKRNDAIAKFKAWWEKNRQSEPYKDLKPLTIPDLPDSRRLRHVLPGGMPPIAPAVPS